MRYELTDYEWAAIEPFLPNKPRGVPRVNDRRVIGALATERGVLANIPPRCKRDDPACFSPYLAPAIWSSGSSTRSNSVGALQLAPTSWQQTT